MIRGSPDELEARILERSGQLCSLVSLLILLYPYVAVDDHFLGSER